MTPAHKLCIANHRNMRNDSDDNKVKLANRPLNKHLQLLLLKFNKFSQICFSTTKTTWI